MRNSAIAGVLLTLLTIGCSRPASPNVDAKERLEFQIGTPGLAVDEETLEAVRRVVQRRLLQSTFFPKCKLHAAPPDRLVVLTPDLSADEQHSLRRLVTRPGTIEFVLTANQRDHGELIAEAEREAKVALTNQDESASWYPVATDSNGRPRELFNDGSLVLREVDHEGVIVKEVLVVLGPPKVRITDAMMEHAGELTVSETGKPAIGFSLTEKGGYLLKNLTLNNQAAPDGFRRRLAMVLDGSVYAALPINGVVGTHGMITAEFTKEERDEIVIALNGRLPVQVNFLQSQNIKSD